MTYAVGSLVSARGREWVVLPESTDDVILARPLGGTDDEIAGICTALEEVVSASFALPDPARVGDHHSCRLLRNALRLGFRSSAGPFRSFGKIAVEPRPYQLVPLLMALKLDPVRLLISDDVGVGKTIEAALVARELLDRNECQRLAVLCPPHLAEQWQKELADKFHINAELVLSGTVRRLERQCGLNQSLFEVYPHTVVSIDYIKSDRRRSDFIRACPELVIIDEAHTCSHEDARYHSRHQRHELVKALTGDLDRHIILVTATPHSGKEAAFRSLLCFLNEGFSDLPDDLSGRENEKTRRRLAAHFIQRRRADIRHFLNEDTPFPDPEAAEAHYQLSPEYKRFFDRVLDYAREIIRGYKKGEHRQRVRWWSALALLRTLASSPAAAAATLRSRSATMDTETPEEADEVGRRQVMDLDDTDSADASDITPGADTTEGDREQASQSTNRRRLLEMAREAEVLKGDLDRKLLDAVKLIRKLLDDGFSPIIFCRFIQTAEYVAEQLRDRLPNRVTVAAVTGLLPPEDREQRVLELAESTPRVLVCTDCLSEGINLQDHFDAVMHYDLSWNPTRHEQRQGRVDRYGQPRSTVRVLTYYGTDNQIDGIVLDVLLRKHQKIRSSLGISVPVPADTNSVVEAICEGLLLREPSGAADGALPGMKEYFRRERAALHAEWDSATAREKRSRTMFAQEAMQASVDEVARELAVVRQAIGSGKDVEAFTRSALAAYGASAQNKANHVAFDLTGTPLAVREVCGRLDTFKAKFALPVDTGVRYLSRTHPFVEGLADYVLNTALDDTGDTIAARCGAIRTNEVDRRTTLLLLRYRYHIVTRIGGQERQLLAEDSEIVGFAGAPDQAEWLDPARAHELLAAVPSTNIVPEQATTFVKRVIDGYTHLRPKLEEFATQRGRELLDAHRRVRSAAKWTGVKHEIRPELPPDVLGIYVYVPATGQPGRTCT